MILDPQPPSPTKKNFFPFCLLFRHSQSFNAMMIIILANNDFFVFASQPSYSNNNKCEKGKIRFHEIWYTHTYWCVFFLRLLSSSPLSSTLFIVVIKFNRILCIEKFFHFFLLNLFSWKNFFFVLFFVIYIGFPFSSLTRNAIAAVSTGGGPYPTFPNSTGTAFGHGSQFGYVNKL